MTERIGQYYFEVNNGELVNNGKIIELDEHGSKRFTRKDWKSLGKYMIGGGSLSMAGGFAAVGLVEMLRGTPILEFASKPMDDSAVMPDLIGLMVGMFGTMFLYTSLEARLKQAKIQKSFIKS